MRIWKYIKFCSRRDFLKMKGRKKGQINVISESCFHICVLRYVTFSNLSIIVYSVVIQAKKDRMGQETLV
jgi:hypothetical protein